VDQDQQRQLSGGVRGPHDPGVHLGAVLRVGPEVLGDAQVQVLVLLVVETAQTRGLGAGPDGEDFGWTRDARSGDDGGAVRSEIEVAAVHRRVGEAADFPSSETA